MTPLERMMDGDAASFLGAWILAREGEAYAAPTFFASNTRPNQQPSRTRTKRNKPRDRDDDEDDERLDRKDRAESEKKPPGGQAIAV